MGIIDWFNSNIDDKERDLTRDLISIAIADGEFSEEERQEIIRICRLEGVSDVELTDSMRGKNIMVPKEEEEKERYILHLIDIMKVDHYYSSLEIHMLYTLAKRVGISPIRILALLFREVKQSRMSRDEAFDLTNSIVYALVVFEESKQ